MLLAAWSVRGTKSCSLVLKSLHNAACYADPCLSPPNSINSCASPSIFGPRESFPSPSIRYTVLSPPNCFRFRPACPLNPDSRSLCTPEPALAHLLPVLPGPPLQLLLYLILATSTSGPVALDAEVTSRRQISPCRCDPRVAKLLVACLHPPILATPKAPIPSPLSAQVTTSLLRVRPSAME